MRPTPSSCVIELSHHMYLTTHADRGWIWGGIGFLLTSYMLLTAGGILALWLLQPEEPRAQVGGFYTHHCLNQCAFVLVVASCTHMYSVCPQTRPLWINAYSPWLTSLIHYLFCATIVAARSGGCGGGQAGGGAAQA